MTTPALTSPSSTTVLGAFLDRLAADGATEKNRRAHASAVQRLGEFLRPRLIEQATSNDLRAFLSYLGQLGVSEQSRGIYSSVLERWIAFCAARAPLAMPIDIVVEPEADADDTAIVIICEDDTPPMPVDVTGPFGHASTAPAIETPAPTYSTRLDAAIAAAPPAAPTMTMAWPAPAPSQAPPTAFAAPEQAPAPPNVFAAPAQAPASPSAFAAPVPAEMPMVEPDAEATWCMDAVTNTFGDAPIQSGPPADGHWNAPLSTIATSAPSSDGFHEPMSFGVPAPAAPATPADRASVDGEALAPPDVFGAPPAMPAKTGMGVREIEMGRLGIAGNEEVIPLAAAAPAKVAARSAEQHDAMDASAAPKARRAPAAQQHDEASPQWTARLAGGDKQLDMTALRNMVLRGQVGPKTAIRRDGGEWMRAGDYGPLKGSFNSATQGIERVEAPVKPTGPIRFAFARAILGAVMGMLLACITWWITTVIVGHEVHWSVAVAAPLVGVLTCWTCRSATPSCVPLSGVATFFGMIAGRLCVHETLAAGLTRTDPTTVPDATAFLVTGLSSGYAISALGAVGLACAVAAMGYLHRSRP